MNSLTVSGNITRDSEVRFLADGSSVASFSIADNQGKDKDAIFWNCSLFGKRAESLNQYLTKGASVTVVGSIQQDKFNDKETGQPRTVLKIRVNDIALQGSKQEGQRQESAPAPRQQQAAPAKSFDDFSDDVPFATCAELNDPLFSRHNKGEW